jgi:hypothetical protein
MLFRRISSHIQGQNWLAIAIDLLIVILGVFIGIQVSNWNDSRKDKMRADDYLVRLHGDIMSDAKNLERRIEYWEEVIINGKIALDYAENGAPESLSNWNTLVAFFRASRIWPFEIKNITYQELSNAGELSLIYDKKLREAVAEYYAVLDRRSRNAYSNQSDYRVRLRELTPVNIQEYMWENCFSDLSAEVDARRSPEACAAPKIDFDTHAVLTRYSTAPDVIRALRYWIPNLAVTVRFAERDQKSALALAKQIGAKLE